MDIETLSSQAKDEESAEFMRELLLSSISKIEPTYQSCIQASRQQKENDRILHPSTFSAAWLSDLPIELHEHAERFIGGHRDIRLLIGLRTELLQRVPVLELVSDLVAKKLGDMSELTDTGAVAARLLHYSPFILQHFEALFDSPELTACFWLLVDFLDTELWLLEKAGMDYYGMKQECRGSRMRTAKWLAVFTSLIEIDPSLSDRYCPRCARKISYLFALVERTRWNFLNLLGALGFVKRRANGQPDIGPDLAGISDDRMFAEVLHAEWDRLLGYEHGAYGFLVEANIGWTEMTRYLRLRYGLEEIVSKTHGYRKDVAWEVCNYLIHRSLVAPEIARSLSPDRAVEVYEEEVRDVFRPLIQAAASRVAATRARDERVGRSEESMHYYGDSMFLVK